MELSKILSNKLPGPLVNVLSMPESFNINSSGSRMHSKASRRL